MQAFRSSVRVASRFQPVGLPRLVRGYSDAIESQYKLLLVSKPKPGVGFSMFLCFLQFPSLHDEAFQVQCPN